MQSRWNPAQIRDRNTLYLTRAEQTAIQQKMPPAAADGKFYADAVFEGGGVRGAAFLGALRCFDDAGIQLRKVAGTSAGAITAALIAAEFSIDELEQIIGELDFAQQFLGEKSSRWILNGSPEDDLENPVAMLANLTLVREQGQYSSEPFYQWLSGILAHRLETFAPVVGGGRRADGSEIPWYQQRQLKIVISDISEGEMRILPEDLPKRYKIQPQHFSVAEAVRLSMSIPLFFEPGKLGESAIIDGGILSNFPLWLYDTPSSKVPLCPTFGLQLTGQAGATQKVDSALDVVQNMMTTMMVARDRHYTRSNDQHRIIQIDTSDVTTTQFNLGNPEKDYLYAQGYAATKQFLLRRWDWQQHLKERGHREDPDRES